MRAKNQIPSKWPLAFRRHFSIQIVGPCSPAIYWLRLVILSPLPLACLLMKQKGQKQVAQSTGTSEIDWCDLVSFERNLFQHFSISRFDSIPWRSRYALCGQVWSPFGVLSRPLCLSIDLDFSNAALSRSKSERYQSQNHQNDDNNESFQKRLE